VYLLWLELTVQANGEWISEGTVVMQAPTSTAEVAEDVPRLWAEYRAPWEVEGASETPTTVVPVRQVGHIMVRLQ
jgi:hypothetical protein